MMFWVLDGGQRIGPFSPEELVWKRAGDLNVLACRGRAPAVDRRAWKLARFFPDDGT